MSVQSSLLNTVRPQEVLFSGKQVDDLQPSVDAVPADIIANEDLTPHEKLHQIDALTQRLQVRTVARGFWASRP